MTVISPRGNVTAFGTMPKMQSFAVAATFNVGMFEYDGGFVFMPIATAQQYFNTGMQVTSLEIFLDRADDTALLQPKVVEAVDGVTVRTNRQARVYNWQTSNQAFFSMVKVERNVMFVILTLIVLVAALNIISGLIMLVNSKGRDIAVLRTVGATKGAIMRVFLLNGSLIGIAGTSLGVTFGLLISYNLESIRRWLERLLDTDLFAAEIYFLSQLPSKVNPAEITSVVAMTMILTFLATLYPAWRASRLDPIEALRYGGQ